RHVLPGDQVFAARQPDLEQSRGAMADGRDDLPASQKAAVSLDRSGLWKSKQTPWPPVMKIASYAATCASATFIVSFSRSMKARSLYRSSVPPCLSTAWARLSGSIGT